MYLILILFSATFRPNPPLSIFLIIVSSLLNNPIGNLSDILLLKFLHHNFINTLLFLIEYEIPFISSEKSRPSTTETRFYVRDSNTLECKQIIEEKFFSRTGVCDFSVRLPCARLFGGGRLFHTLSIRENIERGVDAGRVKSLPFNQECEQI